MTKFHTESKFRYLRETNTVGFPGSLVPGPGLRPAAVSAGAHLPSLSCKQGFSIPGFTGDRSAWECVSPQACQERWC